MDEVVRQLEVFRDEQFNAIHTPPASMNGLVKSNQGLGEGEEKEPSPESTPEVPRQSQVFSSMSEDALQSAIFVVDASVDDFQISTEGGKRVTKYEVHLKMSIDEEKTVWKRYNNFR